MFLLATLMLVVNSRSWKFHLRVLSKPCFASLCSLVFLCKYNLRTHISTSIKCLGGRCQADDCIQSNLVLGKSGSNNSVKYPLYGCQIWSCPIAEVLDLIVCDKDLVEYLNLPCPDPIIISWCMGCWHQLVLKQERGGAGSLLGFYSVLVFNLNSFLTVYYTGPPS